MERRSGKSSPGPSRLGLSFGLFLLCCCLLACRVAAHKFVVGGTTGWATHPSEDYNKWAGKLRFLTNDVLYFKYKKGEDSVLLVNREDYDSCNTKKPIQKLDGGDSTFTLDRSGPFYFISGQEGHCQQGQKLIVVVISVRQQQPPGPGSHAASPTGSASGPATSSAPTGSETSSPSPSQTPGAKSPAPAVSSPPSPVAMTPASSPAISTPTPLPSPAVPTSAPSLAPKAEPPSYAAAPVPAPVSEPMPPSGSPSVAVPGPETSLAPGASSPSSSGGSLSPAGSVAPGSPMPGASADGTGTPSLAPGRSSAYGIHPAGFTGTVALGLGVMALVKLLI